MGSPASVTLCELDDVKYCGEIFLKIRHANLSFGTDTLMTSWHLYLQMKLTTSSNTSIQLILTFNSLLKPNLMQKSPTLIWTSNEMKIIPFLLEFIESLQTQEDIWISTPTIMQGTKKVLSSLNDRADKLCSDKVRLDE